MLKKVLPEPLEIVESQGKMVRRESKVYQGRKGPLGFLVLQVYPATKDLQESKEIR